MKIYVNRVPEEGLQDRASYNPGEMDMDRFDIHPQTPFEVDAFIRKVDQELVVSADIRCPLKLTCGRCLDEFAQQVQTDAVFSYEVAPTDVVDITDDVRQEVLLAYPLVPVCREGCKGLCSTCGQNLNQATCPHQGA